MIVFALGFLSKVHVVLLVCCATDVVDDGTASVGPCVGPCRGKPVLELAGRFHSALAQLKSFFPVPTHER